MQEEPEYFAIYPKYLISDHLTPKPKGAEYPLENTTQLRDTPQIGALLNRAGNGFSNV